MCGVYKATCPSTMKFDQVSNVYAEVVKGMAKPSLRAKSAFSRVVAQHIGSGQVNARAGL